MTYLSSEGHMTFQAKLKDTSYSISF